MFGRVYFGALLFYHLLKHLNISSMNRLPFQRTVSTVSAKSAAAAVLLASFATPRLCYARPPYTGPEVTSLAAQSVNVMRLEQNAVSTMLQTTKDSTAYYYSTWRGMVTHFQAGDGTVFTGGLNRLGLSAGTLRGRPDEFAWFIGGAIDGALVSPNHSGMRQYDCQTMDLVAYTGLSIQSVAASVGARYNTGWSNLDANGQFGGTEKPKGHGAYIATLHQTEGLTFGGLFGPSPQTSAPGAMSQKDALTILRGFFQPERLFERNDWRDIGLPSIGVERIAAGVDYYGDQYDQVRTALASASPLPSPVGAKLQFPLQMIDIAGAGLAFRFIPQVTPNVMLRSAEGGFEFGQGVVHVAAKAGATKRAASYHVSAQLTLSFWTFLRVSYAYNIPDSTTFFPIPEAHVFGVTIGFPDTATADSYFQGHQQRANRGLWTE